MRAVLARLHGDIPGLCRSKSTEIAKLEKRAQNMVAFIAEGRASESVAASLAETAQLLALLRQELRTLEQCRKPVDLPGKKWVRSRISRLDDLLRRRGERRARRSGNCLGR